MSGSEMTPTDSDATTGLLQAVFDVLPIGIVLLDASGTPVLANPAMRRYLPDGVIPSADAARYGRWRGYHADGRRIERTDYPGARALRGERVVPGVEFLYRDDDGRETWVRVAAMPLKGENGCTTGAVVVAANIDAAKRADETLRRSEERQAYLLGLSDALRPLADPAEIQAAAARILGEYLGVTRVVYGEVSADGVELVVGRSYVVGSAPVPSGHYRMADFGETLLAALRGGRTIAVPDVSSAAELSAAERAAYTTVGVRSLAAVPLVKHGRFVANLTVHHATPRGWSPDDLALIEATAERTWAAVERARAEGARRASEARLVAIANLVPDLLWSSDAGGKTDWYNQRWLEYSGQTPAEAYGDGWLEAVHPDDRELSVLRFQAAAARGEPLRHEHRIRSAAGEYRWFLVQARPEHDEGGNIVRWLGAATDIDDLKRAEASLQRSHAELDRRVQERTAELQQLSAARQELLQRLVTVQEDERRRIARELHDSLGQFLSALNLRLSMLEQTAGMTSPVLEEIEQLRPAVQQIDRELDRLTMELRPPALDDFGLPAALRNYAAAWARLANIPVEVYVTGLAAQSGQAGGSLDGPRLSPEVETSVYRIVQEALTNVLKHAQATAVSVIVERRRASLSVIVEDNGVGFDPEAPVDVPSEQPDGGSPTVLHLGLLGMQERAALVGGSVQVESAPGSGTTIYVQIPFGP